MADMHEGCLYDYTLPFAAWEIRLYLNSHPNDRCALKLYDQLMKKARCANYASIDLDCSYVCEEPAGSVLDWMDNAACASCGNLDELMEHTCECQEGDSCPLRWSWVDDPWPWDGCCTNCTE